MKLISEFIRKVTYDELNLINNRILNLEESNIEKIPNISSTQICDEMIAQIRRHPSGRLIVPALWISRAKDRLAKDFFLAKKILLRSKLNDKKLQACQETFKEQESTGIISRRSY